LAECAKLGQQWGYDEINLNCGCPSDRVQKGAFGACLMANPHGVADGVKAMLDVVDIPVTVKHRIGIDHEESYEFVRDFVGTVAQAGCSVFIVHARNAWLKGLSPKQNREVPPLRYEWGYRLKRDFPALTIVLNGGIATQEDMQRHLAHVDGVMMGRSAYQHPWNMASWDAAFFATKSPCSSLEQLEGAWFAYLEGKYQQGMPWLPAMRHALGLRNGLPGARQWRQFWSDHRLKEESPLQAMHFLQKLQELKKEPIAQKSPQ
jgi:tRNA-dihydrouridine synthase A